MANRSAPRTTGDRPSPSLPLLRAVEAVFDRSASARRLSQAPQLSPEGAGSAEAGRAALTARAALARATRPAHAQGAAADFLKSSGDEGLIGAARGDTLRAPAPAQEARSAAFNARKMEQRARDGLSVRPVINTPALRADRSVGPASNSYRLYPDLDTTGFEAVSEANAAAARGAREAYTGLWKKRGKGYFYDDVDMGRRRSANRDIVPYYLNPFRPSLFGARRAGDAHSHANSKNFPCGCGPGCLTHSPADRTASEVSGVPSYLGNQEGQITMYVPQPGLGARGSYYELGKAPTGRVVARSLPTGRSGRR